MICCCPVAIVLAICSGRPRGWRDRAVNAQASGLCRCLHLRPYAHHPPRGRATTSLAHPAAPGRVAHLHPECLLRPLAAGRPPSRFRPCSKTIMPSMTATQPAAFPVRAKPCDTAWSTVAHAATRWWSRRRAAPATSVMTCGNSIGPPSANILRPIQSIPGWSTPFSRPSPLWNLTSMRRRWQSDSSRPNVLPKPRRSIWSGGAMRRPMVNANAITSTLPIAMARRSWNTRGR